MSEVLVIGDSFAADWSIKYNEYKGWPNLLAEQHNVTNLAQAGVSEYKIYKQLLSVKNLSEFNWVIVWHTSPLRVHTREHPIHKNNKLHKDADLLLLDITYHSSKIKNIFNGSLKAASRWFEYHFDIDYQYDTYSLYKEKISELLKNNNTITISGMYSIETIPSNKIILNYKKLWEKERGLINHFTLHGNQIIYNDIVSIIENN